MKVREINLDYIRLKYAHLFTICRFAFQVVSGVTVGMLVHVRYMIPRLTRGLKLGYWWNLEPIIVVLFMGIVYTVLVVTMESKVMTTSGRYWVKSGNSGHHLNSNKHLKTVKIQMRRLLVSRLIRIFTVCLVYLLFHSSN